MKHHNKVKEYIKLNYPEYMNSIDCISDNGDVYIKGSFSTYIKTGIRL